MLNEEPFFLDPPAEGPVQVEESARSILLLGEGFRYEFDRTAGLFSSLCFHNKELLTRPMEWNVYRAPTDNDQYIDASWTSVGYDRPTVRVYGAEARTLESGGARIACRLGIAAVTVARFLEVDAVWTVDAQGRIGAELQCRRDGRFPYLPRFGVRMFLPREFSAAEYFGYGPYESYVDKHLASRLGVYAQAVSAMHENYLRPQENSSHMGCRYATLTDGAYALTAASETPFSFNVSEYTQEELKAKKHAYELEKCGSTVFCVDYGMSGVGSNSCGPQLLPQYRLDEEVCAFRVTLLPE